MNRICEKTLGDQLYLGLKYSLIQRSHSFFIIQDGLDCKPNGFITVPIIGIKIPLLQCVSGLGGGGGGGGEGGIPPPGGM